MRHPLRIFIFSCFALFITSYWNKGFILPETVEQFGKTALVLTLVFVLIRPLAKVIFLPLNVLTLGIFNFVFYLFVLHIMANSYHLFTITEWSFGGVNILSFIVPASFISYGMNLVLSSVSLSSIINILDQIT